MKAIKHLKISKATDWLPYQRALPEDLRAKEKALGMSTNIVSPLRLTKSTPPSQVTKATGNQNKKYDELLRSLYASNEGELKKAEAAKSAEALLEERVLNTVH